MNWPSVGVAPIAFLAKTTNMPTELGGDIGAIKLALIFIFTKPQLSIDIELIQIGAILTFLCKH